jgi:hypothetical protein
MHEGERGFMDLFKYWKSQDKRMNEKDKLKFIYSACKQLEKSPSFESQGMVVNVMVRLFKYYCYECYLTIFFH